MLWTNDFSLNVNVIFFALFPNQVVSPEVAKVVMCVAYPFSKKSQNSSLLLVPVSSVPSFPLGTFCVVLHFLVVV